jgi:hypothetical protein
MAPKKGMTTNFFHPCLSLLLLDPGSGMGKNQDPVSGINIPDPQHFEEHEHRYLVYFLIDEET